MTDRRSRGTGHYYAPGEAYAWCQCCGKRTHTSKIHIQWDGLKTCSDCYNERQPQDLVRALYDHQIPPILSPEVPDTFRLDASITGVTTSAFSSGPEEYFDDVNTLSVRMNGDALPTATELEVLNGANLCAVQATDSSWEVLQYTVASLTSANNYTLSHLLRGRRGTELAMRDPLAAGSTFVYIGQSSASTEAWMHDQLNLNHKAFSPVDIEATYSGSDITFSWTRRSKVYRLDQDDFDTGETCPLGEVDERYEVDVLSGAGAVLRTLRATATTQVTYTAAQQIADFGAIQAHYTIRVYQISYDNPTSPRGNYREFTS